MLYKKIANHSVGTEGKFKQGLRLRQRKKKDKETWHACFE